MEGDDNEEYTAGGASGASETYPMQCSALRKNGFVMIKSRPCKIVEMSTSKTGKHGHAKVHLVDYQLIDISDDGFVTMMNEKTTETREDLHLPADDELASRIKEEYAKDNALVLTVISAVGEEAIIACKNAVS